MTRQEAEEIVAEALWDVGDPKPKAFGALVADGTYSVSLRVGHAAYVLSDEATRSQMRGWLTQQALNIRESAEAVLRTLEER